MKHESDSVVGYQRAAARCSPRFGDWSNDGDVGGYRIGDGGGGGERARERDGDARAGEGDFQGNE